MKKPSATETAIGLVSDLAVTSAASRIEDILDKVPPKERRRLLEDVGRQIKPGFPDMLPPHYEQEQGAEPTAADARRQIEKQLSLFFKPDADYMLGRVSASKAHLWWQAIEETKILGFTNDRRGLD